VFQARLFQRVVNVFKQLSKGDFYTIHGCIYNTREKKLKTEFHSLKMHQKMHQMFFRPRNAEEI